MGNMRQKNRMIGSWRGACGQPYVRRKPNRLLTLQIGDTANEFFRRTGRQMESVTRDQCANTCHECEKGNKLGVVVKQHTESSKNRLARWTMQDRCFPWVSWRS